jgi:hypothetical protein
VAQILGKNGYLNGKLACIGFISFTNSGKSDNGAGGGI